MKQIIIILLFSFIIKGYSQNKETKLINSKNMKQELIYSQKHYNEKPYYKVKVHLQACFYELFLNDIPVFSYGAKGGITNETPLNFYILKTGKQKLRIRLTPMFNNIQLSEQVDLTVELGFNNIIGEKNLDTYISCGNFHLPEEIKTKKLPFFEIEIPFEAKVPWDYSNLLENAQDLENNPNAKQLATNAVNKFYEILKEKDNSKYNLLMKEKIKKQVDVKYLSEKEIDRLINSSNLSEIKSLYPLPEYDIIFAGNGKLIQIKSKEKDEDGNSHVFKYTVKPLMEGGHDGLSSENHLFYLPKGKSELEIF
jgi:hypothetical protein